MEEEYLNINGKVQKVKSFTNSEIKEIFDSNHWERQLKNMEIFQEVGLNAPDKTFLVAGSRSDYPSQSGKVAGICSLRIDEKDRDKGYPINANHWDFIQYSKDKIIMILSKDKLPKHWFNTEEGWKEEVEENPPHEQ